MKFIRKEHHTVTLIKEMEISEEDIIEAGVTVEEFEQYLLTEELDDDEKTDICWELAYSIAEVNDTEEDWVSDRKGFTEVEHQLGSFDDPCVE